MYSKQPCSTAQNTLSPAILCLLICAVARLLRFAYLTLRKYYNTKMKKVHTYFSCKEMKKKLHLLKEFVIMYKIAVSIGI